MVAAAMKKKVSYSFKMKVSVGGELLNSDCECPAGKGPSSTCKHIACVALFLAEFKKDGNLSSTKTCTEILQTFHKPKNTFKGPPPKAEDLKSAMKHKLADPRTDVKARKNCPSYNDMVRNAMINYKAQTGTHTSFLDISCPGRANIQAAAHDHLYSAAPLTHYTIDRMCAITAEQAVDLEKNTRKQALCQTWREERQKRLTASMFGQICKITERRDIDKLCDTIYGTSTFSSAATQHGIIHEKVARKKLEEMESVTVKASGLWVNPDLPFLGASPDGLIGDDIIVEIKCPYSGRDEIIKPGKHFPYLYQLPDGGLSLVMRSNYYYQIQGQMFLSKRKKCKFVVFTTLDFKVINIELDSEFCSSILLPGLTTFYSSHYKPYLASKL